MDDDVYLCLRDRAMEDPLFDYEPGTQQMLGHLLFMNACRGTRDDGLVEKAPPPKSQNERLVSTKERFLARVGNAA